MGPALVFPREVSVEQPHCGGRKQLFQLTSLLSIPQDQLVA